jgi:LysR family transcriptional activator of nhaA
MLNYHHLRHFLAVAKAGTLTRASVDLNRTPQTLSHQIQTLEETLGVRLFERRGRRLVLSDAGSKAVRFADEIFALGEDLLEVLDQGSGEEPIRLRVGVADLLPKRVAHALIRPVFQLDREVRIVCLEASPERLLADLAIQELDVVISDAPTPPSVSVRARSKLLMESGVTLMAAPDIARDIRSPFPESLTGAPLLVPTERATMRREIDRWLDRRDIHARIMGEFDDFALMGVFAQSGKGAMPVPTHVADEVAREFGVEPVAELSGVKVGFYSHCLEQSLHRPAVRAILMGQPEKP